MKKPYTKPTLTAHGIASESVLNSFLGFVPGEALTASRQDQKENTPMENNDTAREAVAKLRLPEKTRNNILQTLAGDKSFSDLPEDREIHAHVYGEPTTRMECAGRYWEFLNSDGKLLRSGVIERAAAA